MRLVPSALSEAMKDCIPKWGSTFGSLVMVGNKVQVPQQCPFTASFFGEGSPTKIDYRKKWRACFGGHVISSIGAVRLHPVSTPSVY